MNRRSLFHQHAQIRGSSDFFTTTGQGIYNNLAEQTGRSYYSGTLAVTSGSSTVTDSSNAFARSEANNFIVIPSGDAAGVYTISTSTGSFDCTVTPTPTASGSFSYRRHYYTNLEDDLNYIRSMLGKITGESEWYDDPATDLATLSGVRGLDLTPYEDTRVVFQNSSGLTDSANLTFNYNNDTLATKNVTVSGTLGFDTGTTVDEILDSTGSISATSTDDQLATTRLIYNTLSGSLMDGTPYYMYHADSAGNMVQTPYVQFGEDVGKNKRIFKATPTVDSEDGLRVYNYNNLDYTIIEMGEDRTTYSGIKLILRTSHTTDKDIKIYDGMDVYTKFDVRNGEITLGYADQEVVEILQDSDVINLQIANNNEVVVGVGGLALKNSTADVNEILNTVDGDSISAASTDDQLATAKLIYNTVSTTSGTLQSGIDDVAADLITASGTLQSGIDDVAADLVTASGSLQSDIIWEIVDTPTTQIRPKVEHLDKAIYTEGNVTIGGNLTVTGTLFYADTETVQVADNIMVLNYGEPGNGVTAGEAGIQIDRGNETDYQFVFDEGTDTFRIGVSGTQDDFNDTTLQPVATREDTPVDTRVPWWDASSYTFRNQGDTYITVNSGTDTITIASADSSVATFSDNGLKLASGADVTGIVTSISAPGSNDNLVTESGIAAYVNSEITSISGIFADDTYVQVVDDGVNPGYIEMVADGTQVSYWDAEASSIRLGKASGAGKVELSDTSAKLTSISGSYFDIYDYLGMDMFRRASLFIDEQEVFQAAYSNITIGNGISGPAGPGQGYVSQGFDWETAGYESYSLDVGDMSIYLDNGGGALQLSLPDTTIISATEEDMYMAYFYTGPTGMYVYSGQGSDPVGVDLYLENVKVFESSGTGDTYVRYDAATLLQLGDDSVDLVLDSQAVFTSTAGTSTAISSQDTYTTLTLSESAGNIAFTVGASTPLVIDTDGITLEYGNAVNEILNSGDSIDASSTDDQLATAALIYTTVSGLVGGIYATEEYVDNAVSDLASTTYVDTSVSGAVSGLASETYVDDAIDAIDHSDLNGLTASGVHPASSISVDTSNFDNNLSAAENTVQAALDALDEISGHIHYDVDLTYDSGNTWIDTTNTYGTVPSGLVVFFNGVKNRNHTDYYTATVSGGDLYVEFAFNTTSEDWANVQYIVY